MHIEDEHVKLADYYYKNGRADKAFEEYNSLIKMHPYVSDLYFDATKFLIAQRRYAYAIALINSAPNMKHDYYYHYTIGTLHLPLRNFKEAIQNLEKAFSGISDNFNPVSILSPLYEAYSKSGDEDNAARVLTLIYEIDPDYKKPDVNDSKGLARTSISYADVIKKAEELITKKQFGNAEKLLLSLVKVEETFQTNKLLGIVFLAQAKRQLAYKYCMKAYQMDSSDYPNADNLYILTLYKGDMKEAARLLDQIRYMDVKPSRIHQLELLFEQRVKDLESK
jgi:tetratricopeptide (TPR) repeat protein